MDAVPTGQGDTGQPPAGGTPPAGDPPAPTKQFSQDDVNQLTGKAREEGRTKFEKDLLAKLGVEDLGALEARLKAAKEHEDAQLSELERAKKERDEATAAAAATLQEAHRALAQTRLESALTGAGLRADRLPAALRLADLGALKVEGTEVQGVTEAVEQVKAASPEWFGPAASPPDASGGTTSTGTDFRTDKEAARRELAKYGLD